MDKEEEEDDISVSAAAYLILFYKKLSIMSPTMLLQHNVKLVENSFNALLYSDCAELCSSAPDEDHHIIIIISPQFCSLLHC